MITAKTQQQAEKQEESVHRVGEERADRKLSG